MSDADVLRSAKARIVDPKHWTTYRLARDREGHSVSPRSPEACCWCALGALAAVGADDAARYLYLARPNVPWINDEKGHAAVMAMYDDAIAIAEARG